MNKNTCSNNGSDNFVTWEVRLEKPTEAKFENGCSTPLKGWKEQPLRDYAEWMRREIIKAGGYQV